MGCCGRDCCDPKRGTGKCLVFFFTIIFGLGVIISTSAPNWIAFTVDDLENTKLSHDVEWGPFYGQYRTCTTDENGNVNCEKWTQKTVDLSDCEAIQGTDAAELKALCDKLGTWRSTGIICLCLVLIGGCLVFAASCCQMVTCGCCGNSLTCISNVIFGTEVVLSIVSWSFAIASLKDIKEGPSVTHSAYQWAFWLFIATGTVVGALATWMADWASEDSCLRGISNCICGIITCRMCRKEKHDDERGEPLIGDA
mmetsp:Transcript_8047/g.17450  ORF Transcript_8047/g.17450 Transcript_8047/m.17450 type:complete len:254 (-) Transcript_8047:57-818(-)|eukprot:CAMPEP_0183739846 /NCGR_PEP_ID=MMETSP0737-20130205/58165_1 /TAXON_ID=385413 /ORGANISM="Thalassiosira miniscula, Strain CCMP1093" /LENGTH=253 /DNA_ID=CAMNT_0025974745 /DNA_START=103 /DNA_END=864 /DNA_ORIENTATION=-